MTDCRKLNGYSHCSKSTLQDRVRNANAFVIGVCHYAVHPVRRPVFRGDDLDVSPRGTSSIKQASCEHTWPMYRCWCVTVQCRLTVFRETASAGECSNRLVSGSDPCSGIN